MDLGPVAAITLSSAVETSSERLGFWRRPTDSLHPAQTLFGLHGPVPGDESVVK